MKKATRILSLVLVLMMLVGMMPLALFAAVTNVANDTETSVVPLPTSQQISAIGATQHVLTDFEALPNGETATADGAPIAINSYLYSSSLYVVDTGSSTFNYLLEGDGNKAIKVNSAAGDSGEHYMAAWPYSWGEDIVFGVDAKLDPETSQSAVFLDVATEFGKDNFSHAHAQNRQKQVTGLIWLLPDGSLTVYATGEVVGYLNTETYTSVAVRIDLSENRYYIYINGECSGSDGYVFLSDATLDWYDVIYKTCTNADVNEKNYSNSMAAGKFSVLDYYCWGVRVLYNSNGANVVNKPVYLDNAFLYTKPTNAEEKLIYLGGNKTVEPIYHNAEPVALPTADKISAIGATKNLITDFETLASGTTATPEGTPLLAGASLSSDGAQIGAGDQVFQYLLEADGNKSIILNAPSNNSGEHFMVSGCAWDRHVDAVFGIDVKLDPERAHKSSPLLGTIMRFDDGTKYKYFSSADAQTDLYNGLVYLGWDGSLGVYATGEIVGYVNAETYTSVAVRIDLAKNRYYIYVNGVCASDDGYVFLSDSTIATYSGILATHKGDWIIDSYFPNSKIDGGYQFNALDYELRSVKVFGNTTSKWNAPVYVDNMFLYTKLATADEKLVYLGEDKTDYADGFVKDGDNFYYLFNGSRVASNAAATSVINVPNGMTVTVDRFGKVYGETSGAPITSVDELPGSGLIGYYDAQTGENVTMYRDNGEFVKGKTVNIGRNTYAFDTDGRLLVVDTAGYTLSMDGKIGVNYYLDINVAPKTDTYVEFTVNSEKYTVKLSDLKKEEYGYKVTVSIPAAEMIDTIYAQVKCADGTELIALQDYSALNYAHTILNDPEYSSTAKAAVKAMLNYASYAQVEFGYKTKTLANKLLSEADKTLADNAEAIKAKASSSRVNNISEGVTYASTTLGLEGETSMYHFFNVTDTDLSKYTVDGATEKVMLGNVLRVKVAGIKATELDEVYTVTVTYGGETLTINANAFAYAKAVVKNESESESLVNVINALYEYYATAEAYNANPNG